MRALGVAALAALAGPVAASAQATVDDAAFVAIPAGTFSMGSNAGGDARVVRGGAWSYPASRCTAAARAHPKPDAEFIGSRLVREPK